MRTLSCTHLTRGYIKEPAQPPSTSTSDTVPAPLLYEWRSMFLQDPSYVLPSLCVPGLRLLLKIYRMPALQKQMHGSGMWMPPATQFMFILCRPYKV